MNKQEEEDLLMGMENEFYIYKVICAHFNFPMLMKLSKFHPFDYCWNNIWFEIKSRRFNHDKYNTTMVGYNKIEYVRRNKLTDVYFVFVFEDGDYYYKFNPDDKFDTFIGGRNDRNKAEYKKYYYIPITKFIKLESNLDEE